MRGFRWGGSGGPDTRMAPTLAALFLGGQCSSWCGQSPHAHAGPTYLRSWLTHHVCRPQPGFHTGTTRLKARTHG